MFLLFADSGNANASFWKGGRRRSALVAELRSTAGVREHCGAVPARPGTPGLLLSHTPLPNGAFLCGTKVKVYYLFYCGYAFLFRSQHSKSFPVCWSAQRPGMCSLCWASAACVLPEADIGKYSCVCFGKALTQNLECTQILAIRLDVQRTCRKDMFLCAFCDVWWCVCAEVLLALFTLSNVPQDFFPNF